jgi:hypothetical protein|tara:strand:- start:343 stop:501 length:159 start_codon:yes stop_codon:yes gene_type:complete
MEKITLTTQLVNAVMGYLGTRPYQEVFQLIEGLQNEAKSQVQPAVEEPKAAE